MKPQFTRCGPARNYRGAHVMLKYAGRTYLGEIYDMRRDEVRCCTIASVRHFNGEPWPFKPALNALDILERRS